jgi:restriction endonuclease S subunit
MITVQKAFTLKKAQLAKKWRVENNNLDISALIANSGLTVKKISEVAKPHRTERNRKKTADDTFKYIQISDIDTNLGRIKSYRTFKGSEAPNNARRIMSFGDILISTRRPTRGAVVAVPKEFDQEICTVFFTTLKITDWNEVDPWYLALFLRTSLGRFQFQSLITETAYPVISDEDVEDMLVLLPRIEIQRELAKGYDSAVGSFFAKINEAHALITSARQDIENRLLGKEAEILTIPVVGLTIEEVVNDENDNSIESEAKNEQ